MRALTHLSHQSSKNARHLAEGQNIQIGALQPLANESPISTVYAGHQFGYFVPQLGDGRSCLIGEIDGLELSLKGAGTSPFSRGADGRAVLRSSIREYLSSIAMQGLNIPTTRALAIVNSDSQVYREHVENAAIITRVAESHIRFGHFEYFASQGQNENVKKLADFVIKHHMSELERGDYLGCLLYTSPSPRDRQKSRMPSSA